MSDTAHAEHIPQAENTGSGARLVLVTGPSGAGRTTAIHVLEDLGFETIDNLPISLLPRLLEGPSLQRSLALVIDARNRDFSTSMMIETLDRLGEMTSTTPELLYLDCSHDVLVQRFSATRRRHPLAPAETPNKGIAIENDLLLPIRARADILIDSTDLSPHDLRAELERIFHADSAWHLAISVNSFSYKRGIPRGMDMVFDCRFLRNPYWNPGLRSRDGRDLGVADYVEQDPLMTPFYTHVRGMMELLLPAFRKEGKAHLAIGFGCSGGQHRSVTLTEKLAKDLAEQGWQVSIRHREIERLGDTQTRATLETQS